MRVAEARTTLAVASSRGGDLEGAVELGASALDIPRQSVPSLLMVSEDLVTELRRRYGGEPAATDYLDCITTLANAERS